MMTSEIVGRLLESLRPTRHLLTRTLADIPINGLEYRQVDRVVKNQWVGQDPDPLWDALLSRGSSTKAPGGTDHSG